MGYAGRIGWWINKKTPLYGLLYNSHAVTDARGISPLGWHVSTYSDINYLYTNCLVTSLKEIGTSHWIEPNSNATNTSGFTALPGGTRSFVSWGLSYYAIFGIIDNPDVAFRLTYDDSMDIGTDWGGTNKGLSYRYVRDSLDGWVTGETFTDFDGNIYHTVKIDNLIFAVENMAVSHYNNGDIIPEETNNTTWQTLTTGALCAYNNDWSNVFNS